MAVSREELTESSEGVRIDLWLWSVRLFKSRSLAAAACKKGRIHVNGQRCRPSRQVRVGDHLELRQGSLDRILEVKALLRQRVAAKCVADFFIDQTPPEAIALAAEQARLVRESSPIRDSGAGRPTKRERREMDGFAEGENTVEPSFEEFVKVFLRRTSSG